MNEAVREFVEAHRHHLTGAILEVGSFNENGTVRDLIPVTIGIDIREGPGVDKVCDAGLIPYEFGYNAFDCVVSCDALEHMQRWDECLHGMWDAIKPGGVMLLTMAADSKGWHGYPDDYWRLSREDFRAMFGGNEVLAEMPAGEVSIGIIARKSEDLDYSIRPKAVKK